MGEAHAGVGLAGGQPEVAVVREVCLTEAAVTRVASWMS
jgi:hypothetical protein